MLRSGGAPHRSAQQLPQSRPQMRCRMQAPQTALRVMRVPQMLVMQETQSPALLMCRTLGRLPAQSLQKDSDIFRSGHGHAAHGYCRQKRFLCDLCPSQ